MTYALIRQLSGEASLLSQRAAILAYAGEQDMVIESEFIDFEPGDRPLREREPFQDFLHSLEAGDEVVAERIEILGRAMEEVIVVINCMLSRGITLHIASHRLRVDREIGLARILPLIVQMGEESGKQQPRASRPGRPKGRRSASKFDAYLPAIMAGLKAGRSVSALARELGVSRSSLKDYIESRNLKKILDDAWLEEAKKRYRKEAAYEPELACTLAASPDANGSSDN